jgi:hypothetical protein
VNEFGMEVIHTVGLLNAVALGKVGGVEPMPLKGDYQVLRVDHHGRVELSDESIERIARRVAQLLKPSSDVTP